MCKIVRFNMELTRELLLFSVVCSIISMLMRGGGADVSGAALGTEGARHARGKVGFYGVCCFYCQ
nr:MAG TPA: hypothetical protein [Caudoviricetes sp.]